MIIDKIPKVQVLPVKGPLVGRFQQFLALYHSIFGTGKGFFKFLCEFDESAIVFEDFDGPLDALDLFIAKSIVSS